MSCRNERIDGVDFELLRGNGSGCRCKSVRGGGCFGKALRCCDVPVVLLGISPDEWKNAYLLTGTWRGAVSVAV